MIVIQPVVEGHGDIDAVRVLITRIVDSLGRRSFPRVLRPMRQSRGKLVREPDFRRFATLAARRIRAEVTAKDRGFVLVVLDADDDPACELGPRMLGWATDECRDIDTAVVLAVREFETWFAASADSMGKLLRLDEDGPIHDAPETAGIRKGWIEARMRSGTYSPVVDQARLAHLIDVRRCRTRSPSFDKLCREIECRVV